VAEKEGLPSTCHLRVRGQQLFTLDKGVGGTVASPSEEGWASGPTPYPRPPSNPDLEVKWKQL
jgi:hypothetical protein